MTKRDLIEEVMQHYPHFSQQEVEVMVNQVFKSMAEALAQGERIELRGFGSFHLRERRARTGRNPQTGAVTQVPSKRIPFFKVAKELRLRVNGVPRQQARQRTPEKP